MRKNTHATAAERLFTPRKHSFTPHFIMAGLLAISLWAPWSVSSAFAWQQPGYTGAVQEVSPEEIKTYIQRIDRHMREALEASEQAESAGTVEEIKQYVDQVYAAVWGVPSGSEEGSGALAIHDWKTRWQSDTSDFKLETPEKFGVEPPAIDDPSLLGIVGSGRHLRRLIWADSANANVHYPHITASLSNVIGWMRMGYADARGGMPRVDLTYRWDAPSEFWQSTADTGWIFEVFTQAENILRTPYGGDVDMAKAHAADLTALIEKAIQGMDANGNGKVEPIAMEGGFDTVLQHARLAGFDV